MRIAIQGWNRDHGKRILFEGKLKDVEPRSNENVKRYEQDTPYLLTDRDGDGNIRRIQLATNAQIRANGNYLVTVSFTPTDILYACWVAFKDRTLHVLTLNFGEFYRVANERRREMRARHRLRQDRSEAA